MTPRQADKLIKAGKPVALYNTHWRTTLKTEVIIVSRDRWSLTTKCGQVFDRGELQIVTY